MSYFVNEFVSSINLYFEFFNNTWNFKENIVKTDFLNLTSSNFKPTKKKKNLPIFIYAIYSFELKFIRKDLKTNNKNNFSNQGKN